MMPQQQLAPARSRLTAVDHIKASAIVAVVFTHAGPPFWSPLFTSWDYWIRQSWTGFHVPAFLMVAGFLYARPTPLGLGDISRRLGRVLVPYTIASALVYLLGFGQGSLGFGFALATGSALGIYYFVFVLAVCIALSWPISRLSMQGLLVLMAALTIFLIAQLLTPRLQLPLTIFWASRDPFSHFYLGYFVLGWLAARSSWLTALSPVGRSRLASALGVFGISVWIWALAYYPTNGGLNVPAKVGARVLYALGIVALVTAFTRARVAAGWLRFLSDSTLALYLYHQLFQILSDRYVVSWHPVARISFLWTVGFAGAVGVTLAGRMALGRRWARRLLGA